VMIAQETRPIEVSGEGLVDFSDAAHGALAAAAAIEMPGEQSDESKRQQRVRARTISIKRLSKRELERGRQMYPEMDIERPMNRTDCFQGPHAERPSRSSRASTTCTWTSTNAPGRSS